MGRIKELNSQQAEILAAFLDAFDLVGSGWPEIQRMLAEVYGFNDPEMLLENARETLRRP